MLCQSPFFRSLLLGGFSETTSTEPGLPNSLGSAKPLKLELEPNVTRAAFEYCLSQLYGGGPHLVLLPWADTSGCALSEPFAALIERITQGGKRSSISRPSTISTLSEFGSWKRFAPHIHDSESVQPASPRFLLSLLVTASYLEMSDVADRVTELIMASITPFSILTYVRFASDKGITSWSGLAELDQPCRGMENVASQPEDGYIPRRLVEADDEEPIYDYGSLSAKIGDACACYLAKWGISHILPVEEAATWRRAASHTSPIKVGNREESTSEYLAVRSLLNAEPWLHTPGVEHVKIWQYGGMPIDWVKRLLSSDVLCLGESVSRDKSSEWYRYQMIKRIVELRRRTRQEQMYSISDEHHGSRTSSGEKFDDESEISVKRTHRPESSLFGASDEIDEEAEGLRDLIETGALYSHFVRLQILRLRIGFAVHRLRFVHRPSRTS